MKNFKRLSMLLISVVLVLTVLCPLVAVAEDKPQEKITVSISFDSMGGSKCETISGYAGETPITKDMLPYPEKDGYIFKEWRYFNEYGVPFELEVFPNFNITLVAAYEPFGFTVTFEEGISEIYDLGSGIELYAPDTNGYVHETVKEGWRCLKTKKSAASPKFLLSYTNTLEVGKEYEFSVWLKAEEDLENCKIDFLYTENPDVRAKVIGYQNAFDLKEIKRGDWREYKVKFIAATPYVIVKLPNVSCLFVDEINLTPTGADGECTEFIPKNNLFVVIIVIVVLTSAAIALIVLKKKNKR